MQKFLSKEDDASRTMRLAGACDQDFVMSDVSFNYGVSVSECCEDD